jgi:hypothetical protein
MDDKPIIFSTAMVKAILENRKTVTRRVIKDIDNTYKVEYPSVDNKGEPIFIVSKNNKKGYIKCPYQIGQKLWVRETWCKYAKEHQPPIVAYKANMKDSDSERCRQDYIKLGYDYKWKPSIFMPKEYARIWLEVTNVRVEKISNISPMDCISEGIQRSCANTVEERADETILKFKKLWDSINEKRGYGWDTNCWVFVIEFKRIKNK